jgi:hypothetical protein
MAMDPRDGLYYKAVVRELNFDGSMVFVHFHGWNNKFDEWKDATMLKPTTDP